MEKRKRKRIELLDVAKAITIFLVIVGHTTANLDTVMYRRFLYSFHMPLFFFLAGMSTKPRALHGWEEWRVFLKKNVLALVAPYVVWGLIYAPFSVKNFPVLFYGSWAALSEMGTLTSLWYLPSFFVARIMVQGIVTLFANAGMEDRRMRIALGISAVPMFAIGFLLPHLEQGYPWCLDVSFVAAGFILTGMALRHSMIALAVQRGVVLCGVLAASLVVLCLGTVARGDSFELILMCNAQYGNILWFLVDSFAGTLMVLVASMLLIRVAREGTHPFSLDLVSFIGAHTMGIFLLHKPMLQEALMPTAEAIIPGPQLLAAIIASIAALAISMILCILIEAYTPELLGQFPSYATTDDLMTEKLRKEGIAA